MRLRLPWLWPRPAAAALIGPLTWELTYAADLTIKKKKKQPIISWNKYLKEDQNFL